MRLRFGAAMPLKGGRPALVAVEVFEGYEDGRPVHQFEVGYVERVAHYGVDAARDACVRAAEKIGDVRPCFIVDVGTPQGMTLHRALRKSLPQELHRPHPYQGTGPRGPLFSTFLEAYSEGRVHFREGLQFRADLDRALVFYMGGGVGRDGVELDSDEEALVIALGLALQWPRHGPSARSPIVSVTKT